MRRTISGGLQWPFCLMTTLMSTIKIENKTDDFNVSETTLTSSVKYNWRMHLTDDFNISGIN